MRSGSAVRSASVAGLGLLLSLASCADGPTLQGSPFPSCDELAVADPAVASQAWVIEGFSGEQLVDPGAPGPDFVARLIEGDTVALRIRSSVWVCTDLIREATWVSTNPLVAEVRRPTNVAATFSALAVGSTILYADLRFTNGRVFRAFPSAPTTGMLRPGLIRTIQVVPSDVVVSHGVAANRPP